MHKVIRACIDGQHMDVLELQHELLNAVQRTVALYAARVNPGISASKLERMITDYMLKMQGEAFSNIVSTVPATAEYLWTSGKKHKVVHDKEFCSLLNAIIRADLPRELEVTFWAIQSQWNHPYICALFFHKLIQHLKS